MFRIFFFIIIFGLIVSSVLYTGMITKLAVAIGNINQYFLPYLPWELKLLFSIAILGVIYRLYHHFRH